METGTKPSTRYVGVNCFRQMLNAINVIQVVIACLIIVGSIMIRAEFREYHFTAWYSALYNLPNLWLSIGCFLIVFSVFGTFATVKNSTKLINIYAVSIMFVFILQMAAAITGFTLLPRTGRIIHDSLTSMMENYEFNYKYRSTMDWIQKNFECCGAQRPTDWESLLPTLPDSCCPYNKYGYDCDIYNSHNRGCQSVLYNPVFRGILFIAFSALVVGILQIGAILCGFVLAARVRQSKTLRDIQKWTTSETVLKQDSFATKVLGENDGEINHI